MRITNTPKLILRFIMDIMQVRENRSVGGDTSAEVLMIG